jgi:hypothetical protein
LFFGKCRCKFWVKILDSRFHNSIPSITEPPHINKALGVLVKRI